MVCSPLACFLSLVQKMSLAVKYARARANMINSQQGRVLCVLLTTVYPPRGEGFCIFSTEEREVKKGGLSPINSLWGG